MRTKIAFVPLAAWEDNIADCKKVFPDAITYGSSKVLSYCYPKDNAKLLKMVKDSGLALKLDKSAQNIIEEIDLGLNSIYNCELEIAWEVVEKFQKVSE